MFVNHVCSRDALLRNVATCHGEVFHALLSVAYHTDFHLSVFRTLQSSHGFLLRYNLANERFAVYAYNLVACQDACFLGRSVLHHVLNMNGVLANGELYANARERSFKIVGYSLRILSADVDRVRVEIGKNLRYGLVNKRVDVHLVHILVFNEM